MAQLYRFSFNFVWGNNIRGYKTQHRRRGWAVIYRSPLRSSSSLGPGVMKPGAVSESITTFYDFLPTFAELAGGGESPETDGVSQLSALEGQTVSIEPFIYDEFCQCTKQDFRTRACANKL